MANRRPAPPVLDSDDSVSAAPTKRRLGLPRTFAALRNRDYRLLWLGTLGSFMAMQMQQVARGYLAYEITGSAAVLGIVGLSFGLPQLVFSLFGGVVADRARKRNLLLITQASTGLVALATAILVGTGLIEIWHLIVLGLLQGSIFSFNMPARQAFLAELVGPKDMMNAIALNNAGMNSTRIVGPALAGLLISLPFFGLAPVFYLIAACYLLPFLMLLQIKPALPASVRKRAAMSKEFAAGMRYIGKHEVLGMLLALGFIPIILGFPYQTLLPVFAGAKVFDVGGTGLGLMSSATGIGALVGALTVATLTNIRRRGQLQLATGALFGVSLLGLGLAPSFIFALFSLVVVGFAGSTYQSLNSTLIMASTDPDYYGRVMSVNQIGFSLMPIASLPTGAVADQIGAPHTVAGAGVLVTLFVTAVATLLPSYRRLELEAPAEAGHGPRGGAGGPRMAPGGTAS